jgi:hypothetical protein
MEKRKQKSKKLLKKGRGRNKPTKLQELKIGNRDSRSTLLKHNRKIQ